jgi:hypothetical protein
VHSYGDLMSNLLEYKNYYWMLTIGILKPVFPGKISVKEYRENQI